jgi:two-component sensor histidine kinase
VSSIVAISSRRQKDYRTLSIFWILLVVSGLSFYLVRTYQTTYELLAAGTENEAAVLAGGINAAFRRAESVMDWAEVLLAEGAISQDRSALGGYLETQTRRFPEIHGFVVYAPDGRPAISTIDGDRLCGVDFSSLVEAPSGDYVYSSSMDCDATDTRIMLAYRLLTTADGDAVGTIATVINLSHYEELFSQVDVGRYGMVSVRRSDTSRLVVRWPFEPDRMNNAAPEIPPQRMIGTGSTRGVVRYVGATDGIERIFAYNRVADYPFYVLVGRGYAEQFAPWRRISAIAVMAALLMITLTLFLLRRLRKETDALVTADATVHGMIADKEQLIHELLHRTNNSLQVVRSAVQLELLTAESDRDRLGLIRIDSRVGILSLVQQLLNESNGYTWVSLPEYLELITVELTRTGALPSHARCDVQCPEMQLVLDAASPVGLIVGELLAVSTSHPRGTAAAREPIHLSLTVSEERGGTVRITYTDSRGHLVVGERARQLITALAEHQLAGSVTFDTAEEFVCAVVFDPRIYRPRVGS